MSGAGAPDCPRVPRIVSNTSNSAHVKWEEPLNNGASITEYQLQMNSNQEMRCEEELGSQPWNLVYSGMELSHEVTKLQPANLYHFRVQV